MKYTIAIISTFTLFLSCNRSTVSHGMQSDIEDSQATTMLDFDSLPSISGADTIVFNKKMDYLSGPNKESDVGNWFQLNSDLYYLVEQRKYKDFIIHELQIYNANDSLLASKLLSDTSFVLKSPRQRTSRAYREVNWIYIESGVKSADSVIILKSEKFEIVSLLGSEYDDIIRR